MSFASPLALALLQLTVILVVGRVMASLFARLRQPQTIGEIVAGIMLGPSLLGWLWPAGFHALFDDPASLNVLNVLAQLGVLLFLFVVGLEFDPAFVRRRGRAAAAISITGIVVPFTLGFAVTYLLRDLFAGAGNLRASALFMGAAMSVTAFPVLARIVTEWNLQRTDEGGLALAAAAVDDVLAWTLLAVVVAFAPPAIGATHATHPAAVLGYAAVYLLAMWLLVRPLLARAHALLDDGRGGLATNVFALAIVTMLLSAFATETIGVHALFGAFVAGLVMPKRTAFVQAISLRIEGIVLVLLLPIFFVAAGLKVDLRALLRWDLLGYTALLTTIACAGKLGGTTLAARASGLPWRRSLTVGVLMNTRGLMELIILTVGLQLGVIDRTVYGMMVVMALVTTAIASPLLRLLRRDALPVARPTMS